MTDAARDADTVPFVSGSGSAKIDDSAIDTIVRYPIAIPPYYPSVQQIFLSQIFLSLSSTPPGPVHSLVVGCVKQRATHHFANLCSQETNLWSP